MYRGILWNQQGEIIASGDETLIERWQQDDSLYLWLDCQDNNKKSEAELFGRVFAVNPFAVSDAQRDRHPPKIEVYDETELLLLKELREHNDDIVFDTQQLAILTGVRFILTRSKGSSVVERLWQTSLSDGRPRYERPRSLAVLIAQYVADEFLQLLITVEDKLEDVEEEVFSMSDDRILTELIAYQMQLRKLTRVLLYHKQLFSNKNFNLYNYDESIDPPVWTNTYEHTERSHSLAVLFYEMASDLIDGHISVSSHRLNQIMKVLTVITVVFVPLSFLAGIYGMNFEFIPELKFKYAYFILLGVMLSIVSVLLFLFRRRKWL